MTSFIDEAEIEVKAGDGGDGIVAFRREKFVPRGGPSGGHGGHGGNVVLIADEGMNTLYPFRFTKRFEAERGTHGGGNDRRGKDGADLTVSVPTGTIVRDAASDETVADLVADGQKAVVARGGRGGRGNSAFKSPTNQAPRFAEKGEPGEGRRLKLELKLMADVGIIGLPNAGKSTLLARISAARPKIADYPFTTLSPSLGVAEIDQRPVVFADIPGLIEGASEGAGLGHQFLRHIERTRLLVHLLDGMSVDPLADFSTLNKELAAFSQSLAQRPQVVALNKIDLPDVRERLPDIEKGVQDAGGRLYAISAATGENVLELLRAVAAELESLPEPAREPEELPVLRPLEEDEDAFQVFRIKGGGYRVKGVRVERAAAMTDWDSDAALARFQRVLDAIGVSDELRRLGVEEGETVRIANFDLEWYD